MKTFMTLTLAFLTLWSNPSRAQEIGISPQVKSCLNAYVYNEAVQATYPDLYLKEQSENSLAFAREVKASCDCVMKKNSFLKPEDRIFSKMLENLDSCAEENFSKFNYKLSFATNFVELLSPEVDERVEEWIPGSFKMVMTQLSWAKYKGCMMTEAVESCTKVESLSKANSCIHGIFSQTEKFYKSHDRCKQLFTTKDSLEDIISNAKSEMI